MIGSRTRHSLAQFLALHETDFVVVLADEMADVLFVLICLANQTGVDLTEAMRKNLEKKTKRDAQRHADNEKLR